MRWRRWEVLRWEVSLALCVWVVVVVVSKSKESEEQEVVGIGMWNGIEKVIASQSCPAIYVVIYADTVRWS